MAGAEPLKGALIGATRQQSVSIVVTNPFGLVVKRVVAVRPLTAAGLVAPEAPLGARLGYGARPGPSRVAGAEPPEGGPLIGATRQQQVSIVVTNPFGLVVKRVVAVRPLTAAGLVAPEAPLGASPLQ
ncbi:hypothetical protein CCM_09342 [Cordyceps militaris CM01]|uniref:Uncharacterized protein n=1 Tax=Cordyceps militaris (strain CM01) TaxID=983644 RepID=G3JUI4_CORMM|nr:uncharacterized protein CCM_09342 [Cordyceps militaris CM01]EGX87720.1 hypothetical protein CCM_09342 [Cordyceps militaris CM01]